MKKLSETQQKILNELKNTIAVLKKYQTYEEFYDNSRGEQRTFTTGYNCNFLYSTSEKAKLNGGTEEWERGRKAFEECKNNGTLITYAKTETLEKLEALGYIQIVRKAQYKGGAEVVKVICQIYKEER